MRSVLVYKNKDMGNASLYLRCSQQLVRKQMICMGEYAPMLSWVGADIAIDAGTADGGAGHVRMAGQQDKLSCLG